jgi:hypothetical protein
VRVSFPEHALLSSQSQEKTRCGIALLYPRNQLLPCRARSIGNLAKWSIGRLSIHIGVRLRNITEQIRNQPRLNRFDRRGSGPLLAA